MLNQLPSHAGTSPAQIARTYAPNPDKLAARTHNPNIPPELVDLLAEDELNRKRKEARAAIDAKMVGPQPTVAEKLRSENENGVREDVKQSLGIAGVGMAPPQGGLRVLAQGQPQMQQPPMQQGLMGARSNLPGQYQQGGIVAFRDGGSTDYAGSLMDMEMGDRTVPTQLSQDKEVLDRILAVADPETRKRALRMLAESKRGDDVPPPPPPPPSASPRPAGIGLLGAALEKSILGALNADPDKAGQAAIAEEAQYNAPGRAAMTDLLAKQGTGLQDLQKARMEQAAAHSAARQGGIDQLAKMQAAHRAEREARANAPFAMFRGPSVPRGGEDLWSGLGRGVDERAEALRAADVADATAMRTLQEGHRAAETTEMGQRAKDMETLNALNIEIAKAKNAGNAAAYQALMAKKKQLQEDMKLSVTQGVELEKARQHAETNRIANLARADTAAASREQRENQAVERAVEEAERQFRKSLTPIQQEHINKNTPAGDKIRKDLAAARRDAERRARHIFRGEAPPEGNPPLRETSVGTPSGPLIQLPGGGTATRRQ